MAAQVPGKMVKASQVARAWASGVENGRDRRIPEQSLGKYNTTIQYNTRTVIRQIQATLPTKKSGLSRRIFRRKSFGSRSTVCLKERRSFFPLHILGLINVGQICYNLLQTSVTVNERRGKVMFAMESLAANWGQPRLLKISKACLGAPPTGGKTQCWCFKCFPCTRTQVRMCLHVHTSQNLPLLGDVHSNF